MANSLTFSLKKAKLTINTIQEVTHGIQSLFTDFCTGTSETLPQKLARLILAAGIDQIDFKDKFVAIKIHFGELGNMAHLRPGYARVLIDIIKDLGGKPFLTDSNTLYIGSRKNALDHIETAYLNGFTPYSTGAHVIIADGLKGTDEVAVPVAGGQYVKEAPAPGPARRICTTPAAPWWTETSA